MSTFPFRLLVTVSRGWSDQLTLRLTLGRLCQPALEAGRVVTVVHGGNPNPDLSTRGDRMVAEWVAEMAEAGRWIKDEPHPADWYGPCRATCEPGHRETWQGISMCPAAGPYRNQEMVDLGADLGLGALKAGAPNRGSRDCIMRMVKAGIQPAIIIQGSARQGGKGTLAGFMQENGLTRMN